MVAQSGDERSLIEQVAGDQDELVLNMMRVKVTVLVRRTNPITS